MAPSVQLIQSLCGKMGISNNEVTKKAGEFVRLLDIKIGSSWGQSLNMSESTKLVICIDLAASTRGLYIEEMDAFKFAGVKKSLYMNLRNVVEKLLDLREKLDVRATCVQLGIAEAVEQVAGALNAFFLENPNVSADNPVHVAAGIYAICKVSKIKVDQKKLTEIARVKKSQFEKLSKDFCVFFESNSLKSKQKPSLEAKTLMSVIVQQVEESEKSKGKCEEEENQISESYEDWKKRMLEDI